METKNIKDIIKADLANAGEGFEKDYPLDKDNWISVGSFGNLPGHVDIGEHINGSYHLSGVWFSFDKDNFDAAWEKFIKGLNFARKIQWKAGHRKTSLDIKNFLIKLGELEVA